MPFDRIYPFSHRQNIPNETVDGSPVEGMEEEEISDDKEYDACDPHDPRAYISAEIEDKRRTAALKQSEIEEGFKMMELNRAKDARKAFEGLLSEYKRMIDHPERLIALAEMADNIGIKREIVDMNPLGDFRHKNLPLGNYRMPYGNEKEERQDEARAESILNRLVERHGTEKALALLADYRKRLRALEKQIEAIEDEAAVLSEMGFEQATLNGKKIEIIRSHSEQALNLFLFILAFFLASEHRQ